MSGTRRKAGLLGSQVEGYRAWLLRRGYTPETVRNMLKDLGQLGLWSVAEGLALAVGRCLGRRGLRQHCHCDHGGGQGDDAQAGQHDLTPPVRPRAPLAACRATRPGARPRRP